MQRNKNRLEEESYAAKIRDMSPEELAELNRRGQEAMRVLSVMKSCSALAETPYMDMLKSEEN